MKLELALQIHHHVKHHARVLLFESTLHLTLHEVAPTEYRFHQRPHFPALAVIQMETSIVLAALFRLLM